MIVEWSILAEGMTQDARGALTVVGLAQTVGMAPKLPLAVKRAAIILLTGDNEEFIAGRPVNFSLKIEGPSGQIVCENQGVTPIAPNPFPDLPFGVTIAGEVAFIAHEYGRYVLTIEVQPVDHPRLEAKMNFYILAVAGHFDGVATSTSSGTGSFV